MTKERPTHICSLEIDPRDPSAIIQSQADRIAELEEAINVALHFHQVTHIHAALRQVVKL